MRLNRDVVVALVLLVVCVAFYAATYSIRKTSYGTIGSELWPRIVIVFLGLSSLLYLAQSLRLPPAATADRIGGLRGIYGEYRNAIWCFVSFGLFLALMPVLGMLIGGIFFVFLCLSLLGGCARRDLAIHAAISIGTVGAMWLIFTYGLRVLLPDGMIFRFN